MTNPASDPEGRPKDPIVVHLEPDLEPIIPTFLKNQADVIKLLNEALKAGDYATIETRGHGMKGYGGGYGFDALTRFGDRLEREARARNTEEVRRIVGELTDYMSRVEVVYGDPDE